MSDEVVDEIRSVLTDVVEKGPEGVGASWKACAEAGLLGLAAPTAHGGEGLGPAEVAVLVREAGARALDLPFRETLLCGLLTLARSGTPEQQEIFVPRIVAGDLLVAPALNEVGVALPERPATRFEDDKVTGRKLAVPTYDDR
jgi:alkylation response protein AidB-like acyl-CoA dehydrogenase